MRVLIAALLLAGCAAPNDAAGTLIYGTRYAAKEFPVGDGRTGYELTCDGGAQAISACYQRANQKCPTGFDVINSSQTATVDSNQRSILVACKG